MASNVIAKIVIDEDKMRELVAKAVEELKSAGYIWREEEVEE